MHRLTRATVPTAAVLVLAAVAGCDDQSDRADAATSTVATTISRDDWIAQVNQLCVAHNEALGAIIGPLFAAGPPTPDDAQVALEGIVRRTRAITDQIEALPEPSALTIHVHALVGALDAGSDRAEELGGPAFFATDEDPFRTSGEIAGELGLDACDSED